MTVTYHCLYYLPWKRHYLASLKMGKHRESTFILFYKDDLRLLSVALLEGFGLVITFSGVPIVWSSCFFAVLKLLDILSTPVPPQKGIEQSLHNLIGVPSSTLYQTLWSFIINMTPANIIMNLLIFHPYLQNTTNIKWSTLNLISNWQQTSPLSCPRNRADRWC